MFIFYDTETTGLDKDFSQILQIALVFTDDNLNILASKKLECRRSPWVVPSPGALLMTGFVPDDLKNNKLSHFEMMKEVEEWIRAKHWPLTFAGYNSIVFDEPVLAQNLYQSLMTKNLTTAADGNGGTNGRMDIMNAVKAVDAYMPGVLKLKILNEYGKPSFTLQAVAEQNGVTLSEADAHDAMNDIKATVGVAKLLQKAAPQIWEQMMKLSTPAGVDDFISQNPIFTWTYFSYGKARASVSTVLGEEAGQKIIFDLSVDPAPYLSMTAEQLAEAMKSRNGAGSAQGIKPLLVFAKDEQPVLMPMDLSEAVLPKGYNEKAYQARADLLLRDKDFLDRVVQAAVLLRQSLSVKPVLPEQMINNLPDAAAGSKMAQWTKAFRDAGTWKEAAALVQDFYTRFDTEMKADPDLRRFVKFAGRIVFEHAPEELSDKKNEQMKRHIAARVLNTDLAAPYMTLAKARLELEQIEQERAQGKKKWQKATDTQVRALKLYYTAIEKEYAPFAPQGTPMPEKGSNDNPPPASDIRKSSGGKFQP